MLCWSPTVSATVYIELYLVTIISHILFASYFFLLLLGHLQFPYHYVVFIILIFNGLIVFLQVDKP